MGFINYDKKEEIVPRVLTSAERMAITDDFVIGLTETEIKHKRFIPRNLIKQSIAEKKAIERHIIDLMNGRVIAKEEVKDEEGKVISKEEYHSVPTGVTALKTAINAKFKDRDNTVLNYNVDACLRAATKAGTFAAYPKKKEVVEEEVEVDKKK